MFSAQCQRCHAINGEGGRLGPDLNIPRNILEYRAEADVRAYIKDPASFRYGNMPAHPLLTSEHLDQLVCYLREMGKHKFDPRQQPAKTEKGS
jgi:mono/diheme cytochrome c family protein